MPDALLRAAVGIAYLATPSLNSAMHLKVMGLLMRSLKAT